MPLHFKELKAGGSYDLRSTAGRRADRHEVVVDDGDSGVTKSLQLAKQITDNE